MYNNICKVRTPRGQRNWTHEEVKKLKSLEGSHVKDLVSIFKRSVDAIKLKAHKHSIKLDYSIHQQEEK